MIYTESEILQYIDENDVKFVKLTFCDLNGKMKNISILSSELAVTFERGLKLTAKKIKGFETAGGKDLYLYPDVQTMTVLPWRPQQGRVIRMFCYIRYADGTPFEGDGRSFLKKAMKTAVAAGYCIRFGTSSEFTLFKKDENGLPTKIPHDLAGYCDAAPDDKGENIRRDVCLTLEQMGIHPVSSRHESGQGQHEIDFNAASALKAADTFLSFKSAVKSVAENHGVHASFMPKPRRDDCGNGLHISFNVFPDGDNDSDNAVLGYAAAGIMKYARELAVFTNSTVNSYARLSEYSSPQRVMWARDEGSQIIRLNKDSQDSPFELRAADCVCEPYYVFGLMIYAALEGIAEKMPLPPENEIVNDLPGNLEQAADASESSEFIRRYIPENVLETIISYRRNEWREYSSAYDKEAFEDRTYFYSL